MIFLDTSAVYALADRSDLNHGAAVERFRSAVESQEELLIHNAILVEAATLLQRRLGLDVVLRFLEDSEKFVVHWTTLRDHKLATEMLKDKGKRGLSLVDCINFTVMRHHQVTKALAFDIDFQEEGFELYRGRP